MSEDQIAQSVEWALDVMDIDKALHQKSPFALSLGEQRRVALAGCIASRPRYLVLDEPTAGLDPAAKTSLMELLCNLAADGTGIVMATHDMDLLANYANKVAVLDKGRLLLQGTPNELFAYGDKLHEIGLELPNTLDLVKHCAEYGFDEQQAKVLDQDSLTQALYNWIAGQEK